MPEYTGKDEPIIMQIKCAHCFKDMKKEQTFCSRECIGKGYLYPLAHKNNYTEDRAQRRRAQGLASYHRNKKLKVRGLGRPRNDGSNLLISVEFQEDQ